MTHGLGEHGTWGINGRATGIPHPPLGGDKVVAHKLITDLITHVSVSKEKRE